MEYQDRITELRRVPAKDLRANPKNWRLHPDVQRTAMIQALETIGIADALIAREDEDGTLVLLDGHLRKDVGEDQMYPVLITDLTEEEADTFLATFDPITGMATADETLLETLISSVWFDANDELQKLLATVADDFDLDTGFGDLIGEHDHDPAVSTDAISFTVMVPQHFDGLIELRGDLEAVATEHGVKLKVTGAHS